VEEKTPQRQWSVLICFVISVSLLQKMSGELPVNLTGLSINRAWSVVYNQTNDDERAFAAAFLKHHNAVLYLNGLYSDPQINRYKREARRSHVVVVFVSVSLTLRKTGF
jgi:hypothetical protein